MSLQDCKALLCFIQGHHTPYNTQHHVVHSKCLPKFCLAVRSSGFLRDLRLIGACSLRSLLPLEVRLNGSNWAPCYAEQDMAC